MKTLVVDDLNAAAATSGQGWRQRQRSIRQHPTLLVGKRVAKDGTVLMRGVEPDSHGVVRSRTGRRYFLTETAALRRAWMV